MGGALSKLNMKMRAVGKQARGSFGMVGAAGSVFAMGAAMKTVIQKGATFEKAMVAAASRFPKMIRKGTTEFDELEASVRDVGATTEFTATQVAMATSAMAKSGFDMAQTMALLRPTVDLATSTEIELAEAADIATKSLNALGLATKDSAELQRRFIDLSNKMSTVTNTSATNMSELFEAITEGGPAAVAAGSSVETFLALVGRLANAGVIGSRAGTQLKNVFLKLADTNVQRKLRSTFRVNVADINTGELRDFADIMSDLTAAFDRKGLSGLQRTGAINALFGLRGVIAVSNVLTAGVDKFQEYRQGVIRTKVKTAELAGVLRDVRQGELDKMTSAVESLTLSFSVANDEGIGKMIEGVRRVASEMDKFTQKHPEVARFATDFTAFGVAALAVGVIIAGLGAAITFVGGSAAAMVGVVVVAVTAVVAAVAKLGRMIGDSRFVRDLFGVGREMLEAGGPSDTFTAAPTFRDSLLDRESFRGKLTILDETGRAEVTESRGGALVMELLSSGML